MTKRVIATLRDSSSEVSITTLFVKAGESFTTPSVNLLKVTDGIKVMSKSFANAMNGVDEVDVTVRTDPVAPADAKVRHYKKWLLSFSAPGGLRASNYELSTAKLSLIATAGSDALDTDADEGADLKSAFDAIVVDAYDNPATLSGVRFVGRRLKVKK